MEHVELPGDLRAEATFASRPDRLVVRARAGTRSPVVVKASVPGAGWAARAALRAEARLLGRLHLPGVVGLLEVIDRRGQTALVMELVPGGRVADRPELDHDEVQRSVTATVDELDRLGVTHRAVTPDHILLRADATPVLVGFGQASRRIRSSSVSRRTTTLASPSRTNTTGGRGTLL